MSEQDFNAEFSAGFDSPEAGQEAPTEVVVDTPEVAEAAEEAVAAPEVVSLTKDEWDATQARLQEFEKFREQTTRQVDGLAGKYGEVNRTLQSMPKGSALKPDSFAKLKAEFPEIGEMLESSLSTITAPAAPAVDMDEIGRRVQEMQEQREARLRLELRQESLSDAHEDWREVVTSTDFEAWTAKQPKDYADKVIKSNSPKVVADAITAFKASKVVPARVSNTNSKARLEAAITPQGSPSRGAPSKTEVDYLKEGFGN